MKVHQLTRGIFWEHEPSLTLGCKRLRPLAPKLNSNTTSTIDTTSSSSSVASFDLKSFIRPQSGPSHHNDDDNHNINKRDPPNSSPGQVETGVGGGTRWNPTQEQIGILEMLYKGGMRTPNAEQIENITLQLSKYGKIEGKNVFYWFQNHKARERQKQKRNNLGLSSHSPRTPPTTSTFTNVVATTLVSHTAFASSSTTSLKFFDTTNTTTTTSTRGEGLERDDDEDIPYKKCRNWAFEYMEDQNWSSSSKEEDHKTLELFPLHPER